MLLSTSETSRQINRNMNKPTTALLVEFSIRICEWTTGPTDFSNWAVSTKKELTQPP